MNGKKTSEDQSVGKADVKGNKRKYKSGKSAKTQREKAKKRGKQLLSTAASETAFPSDSVLAGLDSLQDSSSVLPVSALDSLDTMISASDSSFQAVADSSSSVNDSSDFVADSLAATSDSLALADSLANLPKDSTKVGFLEAMKNVKMFRSDMQMACDSMLYCDLDSLVRMFKDPMLWQEGTRQYAADSISVLIRNGAMDRASLMSDAFISIKEDETHFDQIKGAEMMAYFDADGGLSRFDVLGGASALFYLQEHDALATVNRKESKMLSATFKNGDIERIYYYDTAKSDGYPVVQLSEEERKLKGFNWSPERCPAYKDSVTTAVLRPLQRREYEARPQAEFNQTDIYFPGYINDIHRQIEVRDSLKAIRRAEAARARELAEIARRDSIAKAISDSLSVADSLALADSLFRADSIALSDSLALADSLAVADSIAVSDSLARAAALENMTPEQIKAKKKAEDDARKAAERQIKKDDRAKKKAARIEAREKKWADADSRDAQKKILKDAKKLAKERAHKRKALESAAEQARKDRAVLERYKARYEKTAAAKTAQSSLPVTSEDEMTEE